MDNQNIEVERLDKVVREFEKNVWGVINYRGPLKSFKQKFEEMDGVMNEGFSAMKRVELSQSNIEIEALKQRFDLMIEIADGFKEMQLSLDKKADLDQENYENAVAEYNPIKLVISGMPYFVGGKILQKIVGGAAGFVAGKLFTWQPEIRFVFRKLVELPEKFKEFIDKLGLEYQHIEKVGISKEKFSELEEEYNNGDLEKKKLVVEKFWDLVLVGKQGF